MTCTHVLGLIDAEPFVDYPPAHLEAAWQHARQCTTCGPAMAAGAALTADLGALARPAPPRDLTSDILLRIANADREASAIASAASGGATRWIPARDWSAWAPVGGLTAALVVVLGYGAPLDVPPLRTGMAGGLNPVPTTVAGALAVAAGLVLYVAALFMPLGRRGRT